MWNGHRSVDPHGLGMKRPDPPEKPSETRSSSNMWRRGYNLLVITTAVIGLVWGLTSPMIASEALTPLQPIAKLLRQDPFAAAILIYANNLLVALMLVTPFLGLILLAYNMAIVGSVLALNPIYIVFILPHGIVELPTIFYACMLGGKVVEGLITKRLWLSLETALWQWLKLVPTLLLIAAFIEVYLTPLIAESIVNKW